MEMGKSGWRECAACLLDSREKSEKGSKQEDPTSFLAFAARLRSGG
jgi:hypothetical protein